MSSALEPPFDRKTCFPFIKISLNAKLCKGAMLLPILIFNIPIGVISAVEPVVTGLVVALIALPFLSSQH